MGSVAHPHPRQMKLMVTPRCLKRTLNLLGGTLWQLSGCSCSSHRSRSLDLLSMSHGGQPVNYRRSSRIIRDNLVLMWCHPIKRFDVWKRDRSLRISTDPGGSLRDQIWIACSIPTGIEPTQHVKIHRLQNVIFYFMALLTCFSTQRMYKPTTAKTHAVAPLVSAWIPSQ